jgi:hypothetical protein
MIDFLASHWLQEVALGFGRLKKLGELASLLYACSTSRPWPDCSRTRQLINWLLFESRWRGDTHTYLPNQPMKIVSDVNLFVTELMV